ncbi:hypothetical protein Tco_1023783, partial [Tanacetum coccineum]
SFKDGDGDGDTQPHKGVKASANSDVMYFFTSAQDGDPSQDDISNVYELKTEVIKGNDGDEVAVKMMVTMVLWWFGGAASGGDDHGDVRVAVAVA